jgi:hypothetical protein
MTETKESADVMRGRLLIRKFIRSFAPAPAAKAKAKLVAKYMDECAKAHQEGDFCHLFACNYLCGD